MCITLPFLFMKYASKLIHIRLAQDIQCNFIVFEFFVSLCLWSVEITNDNLSSLGMFKVNVILTSLVIFVDGNITVFFFQYVRNTGDAGWPRRFCCTDDRFREECREVRQDVNVCISFRIFFRIWIYNY